jgi:hypothetical protein
MLSATSSLRSLPRYVVAASFEDPGEVARVLNDHELLRLAIPFSNVSVVPVGAGGG